MTTLSRVTLQRLKRLPRGAGVWECDRRPVSAAIAQNLEITDGVDAANSDCIVWVDGTEGAVRSLAVVPSDSGYGSIVRALLEAMEDPQGPVAPGCPQKIVVCDREIQFYLRGALQDLDSVIDYAPCLPLTDELFAVLQCPPQLEEPQLPVPLLEALLETALATWELAPWHVLNEQQLLAIDLNAWDVGTLYVSVLGMAGTDYGVLLYRSLESLMCFRQRLLSQPQSPGQIQDAYIEQDCLYLSFEFIDAPANAFESAGEIPPSLGWQHNSPDAIQPSYGSIHPLEGLRTTLAQEEALTLLVAMTALGKFCDRRRHQLERPPFPDLQDHYRIRLPSVLGQSLAVAVRTLPEVTQSLAAQKTAALASHDQPSPVLGPLPLETIVPLGAVVKLLQMPHEQLASLRATDGCQGQHRLPPSLPVVLIQTSRPKAKLMIEQIRQAGGIQSVILNPGVDLISGEERVLGVLQMGQGDLQVFAEYGHAQADRQAINDWRHWCQHHDHRCGVVIAAGVTGAARGNPQPKDMLLFIPTRNLMAPLSALGQ